MNKSVTESRYVSIQLPLGGHSFSAESIADDVRYGSDPVEIVLPCAQTVLLPEEEFDPSIVDSYLSSAGMACRSGQCGVYTPPIDGIVAVMAVEEATHRSLREIFRNRMRYSTPLLEPCPMHRGAALRWQEGLLYARIYDERLLFAEVLPALNDTDLKYQLTVLDSAYHIYNMKIVILGEPAGLMRVCKPIFKHIVCE